VTPAMVPAQVTGSTSRLVARSRSSSRTMSAPGRLPRFPQAATVTDHDEPLPRIHPARAELIDEGVPLGRAEAEHDSALLLAVAHPD